MAKATSSTTQASSITPTSGTVQALAQAVAKLPNQRLQYPSAAGLFAAAVPGGMPRTLGTQGRHCLRATGQGVGRGKRHGVSAAAWLAAYNTVHPNKPVGKAAKAAPAKAKATA